MTQDTLWIKGFKMLWLVVSNTWRRIKYFVYQQPTSAHINCFRDTFWHHFPWAALQIECSPAWRQRPTGPRLPVSLLWRHQEFSLDPQCSSVMTRCCFPSPGCFLLWNLGHAKELSKPHGYFCGRKGNCWFVEQQYGRSWRNWENPPF